MRLLRRENDQLLFRRRVREPYAILSHTWGNEDEEITHKDVCDGTISKHGFAKIEFCLDEARDRHDLLDVWVDSCCIDRTNTNELGESINQMFNYYSEAKVCLVYLADITYDQRLHIMSSRWFTRGWTLQELVAAPLVRFFSRDRRFLGDKQDLATEILRKGIDLSRPLTQTSPLERFKWSRGRKTTKDEDLSYCLVGLLGVKLLPNYGEGRDAARRRLLEAIHDRYGTIHTDPIREEIVKWELLPRLESDKQDSSMQSLTPSILMGSLRFEGMDARRIRISEPHATTCDWLIGHPDFQRWTEGIIRLLWLIANPGSGKSVLMKHALALAREKGSTCIAFFYNGRSESHLDKSTQGMYSCLLYQLLQHHPNLQQTVVNELETSYSPRTAWSTDQLQHAFATAAKGLTSKVQCFIDALDESEDHNGLQTMTEFLSDMKTRQPLLSICMSSRHWPVIPMPTSATLCATLCLDTQKEHSEALETYINAKLATDMLGDSAQEQLLLEEVVSRANGIFLWAELVVNLLNNELARGRNFNVEAQLERTPAGMVPLLQAIVNMPDDMQTFKTFMQWILFSTTALSAKTYCYAMISSSANNNEQAAARYHHDIIENVSESQARRRVKDTSRGLAKVTENDTVELIHNSIRDFLLELNGLRDSESTTSTHSSHRIHDDIKLACMRVLQSLPNDSSNPFARYAGQYVVHHAEVAARSISQDEFIRNFAEVARDRPLYGHLPCNGTFEDHSWPPSVGNGINKIHHFIIGEATTLIRRAKAMRYLEENEPQAVPYLVLAIRARSLAVLHALLDCEVDPDVVGPSFMTPLLELTGEYNVHNIDMMEALLNRGANIEARDPSGATPLMRSVMNERFLEAQKLLECGAELEAVDAMNCTPLILAYRGGDCSMISYLLRSGANANAVGSDGCHLLLTTIRTGGDWFHSHPDSPPGTGPIEDHTIKDWICSHIENSTKRLFDQYGLWSGTSFQSLCVALMLIQHGADPNSIDSDGSTALMLAVRKGDLAMMVLLLSYKADPNASHLQTGCTALHLACQAADSLLSSRLLLDHGALPNCTDQEGRTPLMYAADGFCGSQVIEQLLSRNADQHIVDKLEQNALMHAIEAQNHSAVEALLSRGKGSVAALDDARTEAIMDRLGIPIRINTASSSRLNDPGSSMQELTGEWLDLLLPADEDEPTEQQVENRQVSENTRVDAEEDDLYS